MTEHFDIAVVGAGLAGSCAAILAAQSGARVVLFEGEKVGRHKVCGEFLSPESRVQLQRLGIIDTLREAGARNVTKARISTSARRGQSIALPSQGLAISRSSLDTILWQRALQVGVEARDQTRVKRIELNSKDAFALETPSGTIEAKFVVSATGRGAKWSRDEDKVHKPRQRFVGLKTHLLGATLAHGEVALFPFAGGYCGLVEVECGQVNACLLAPYSRLSHSSPDQVWQQIRRENRALDEIVREAQLAFAWKATGNISFDCFSPAHDGILRAGDAAGYIHPLSGDGMAMALRSGEMVACTLVQALSSHWEPAKAAHIYSTQWTGEFRNRLKWARRLQPLFCNTYLSDIALRMLDRFPNLASIATRQTRGPIPS